MNFEMFNAFVSNKILKTGCDIDINYRGKDLGGTNLAYCKGNYHITEVWTNGDITCFSTEDGHIRKIKYYDIYRIDGMELDRLANIIGFKK